MLQLLGLIVGSYVCLRCLQIAAREQGPNKEPGYVRAFALLALLCNMVLTLGVLFAGSEPPPGAERVGSWFARLGSLFR